MYYTHGLYRYSGNVGMYVSMTVSTVYGRYRWSPPVEKIRAVSFLSDVIRKLVFLGSCDNNKDV